MNGKILVASLLLAGGLWLARKKNFGSSVKFGFKKIDFNMKEKKVVVFLSVLNPTGNSLNIRSLAGSLLFQGEEIATISNFQAQTIEPNKQSTLKVFLTPTVIGLLKKAVQIISELRAKKVNSKKISSAFSFNGSANIEGINIPIKNQLG